MSRPDSPTKPHSHCQSGGVRDIAVHIPAFRLELGGVIEPLTIHAAMDGPDECPLIVVFGGISADRYATRRPDGRPGWWADCLAELRRQIDQPVRILCLDYIYRPHDPTEAPGLDGAITAGDQADALCCVLDDLGIARAEAVIGASYGGAVTLTFAERYPGRLNRQIIAGAAHEPHPMAVAGRLIQRRIVELAARGGHASEGLALARQLAMTTYRSPDEFTGRFSHPPGLSRDGVEFEVGRYLASRGEAFADCQRVDRFLALSQSLDLHRSDPSRITVPTTLIACREDRLVPFEQIEDLARRLAGPARFCAISSPYAHDAFLKETSLFARLMADDLNGSLTGALTDEQRGAAS